MIQRSSKNATIIEVARRAGVSSATAGRVLGDYGYSSPEVQEKVRAAAAALGYRPNRLAKGLITGKTQTIGVVVGDIESPFYASVLRGVGDVARRGGFGVIVTNSDENAELEREAVQLLLEKQVDGLIVSSTFVDEPDHLREAVAARCPVVQFDRIVAGLETDSVVVDNVAVTRSSIAAMIGAGHSRIGILAELGPGQRDDVGSFVASVDLSSADVRYHHPSWQRLLGYLEAHRAAGIEPDLQLVRRVAVYSSEAARKEALDLLTMRNAPSALFTADGVMSTGVLEATSALKLAIPGDVSLLCFDDLDWMQFVAQGITAIAQPAHLIGAAAAELLLKRLVEDTLPFEHRVLAAQIVERNSIAVHV
ncbi:LacI family DNA-binding transcriptional regulator [Mesorhizobium onobrychidis]|uniref:LacI family DNA-binding transcriptional regulator n=1 Tax=Mesorhizobium onobrychidis TaxID=2775404 RepID=A0ABY5QWS1_9HYPH|nr:LacI family DNA-binding transcriptional regulator [Mesorhizobium onobrychidis]UVC14517.1 LacI family DNA-binding transcriptional regulator [Mesorhizobium onobrychidis]